MFGVAWLQSANNLLNRYRGSDTNLYQRNLEAQALMAQQQALGLGLQGLSSQSALDLLQVCCCLFIFLMSWSDCCLLIWTRQNTDVAFLLSSWPAISTLASPLTVLRVGASAMKLCGMYLLVCITV